MRPTETLSREHALVILVTKEAEQEVRYMRDTGEYRKEEVGELVDFFEFFTEACHDPKEERLLFARLCKRGLSRDTGILAQFYREHEEFTTRLRDIEQWLRKDKKDGPLDVGELADQLEAYLNLMRSHVARENEHLFALADGMLTDEDQEELERAFEAVESEEVAEGIHEKYSSSPVSWPARPPRPCSRNRKFPRLVLDAAEREVESTRTTGHLNVENIDGLVDSSTSSPPSATSPRRGSCCSTSWLSAASASRTACWPSCSRSTATCAIAWSPWRVMWVRRAVADASR